jgi:chromosomal replication initiation ATPase DnaA
MRCVTCNRIIIQPWRVRAKVMAPRIPDRFARQVLEQAVLGVFVVASSDLWSGTRGRPHAAFARQVAMYLAHVAWGLTLTEVGQVFARDRTTVAYACGRVEDLRDDVAFDRSLELLEGVLRALSLSSVPLPDQLRAGS